MGRGLDRQGFFLLPGGRAEGLRGARVPELSTSAPAPEPERGRTCTEGRGPRTRLSLQALRTRLNPRATVETATPLSTLLPSGPVASMTPSVRAKRPRPQPWARLAAPPLPESREPQCSVVAPRGRSRADPVAADLRLPVLGCPRHRCPGLAEWASDTKALGSPSEALEITRDSPLLHVELDFFSSSGAGTSAMQPSRFAFCLLSCCTSGEETSKRADYDVASQQSYSQLLFILF